MATPLLHAFVIFRYTGLPVLIQYKCETAIKKGITIPMQENII